MTQSDGRSTEHIFGTLILEKSGVGADRPSLLAVGMSVVENERCPGTTRVERSTTLFLATSPGHRVFQPRFYRRPLVLGSSTANLLGEFSGLTNSSFAGRQPNIVDTGIISRLQLAISHLRFLTRLQLSWPKALVCPLFFASR
jgi:hypothetical protein